MQSQSLVQTFLALVLRHLAGVAGTWLLQAGLVDSDGKTQFVGAVMIIGAVAWSFWQKVGAKKALALAQSMVADAKTAAKMIAFVAFGLLALSLIANTSAVAADLGSQPMAAKAPVYTGCVINNCTGLYAGVGLSGNGTNADIIGSGLSQSVFAAGAQVDLHAGYQFWNGTYFAAIEAGIGYQFTNGGAIQFNGNQLTGYEIVKLGVSLSGLLNTGASPIAIPAALSSALMSPYVAVGAIQHNVVSQFATLSLIHI